MMANDKISQTPAQKIENIVNHIIKFGRSLTDFVIGNHMNTPYNFWMASSVIR